VACYLSGSHGTRANRRGPPRPFMDPLPITISVPSERGTYPVLIGPGLTSRLPALLDEHGLTGDRLVVSCAPVWRCHGARLRALTAPRPPTLVPDGERAKTLATTARIYDALVRRNVDRSGVLVAVGGGVVGDVAGFAAATYLRGIPLVHVPTTLLAQVDSAVGGKVGVNLPAGKNLVGAFHAPALVVADPDVLRTLPRREFRAGLYEVVKYGVVASRPLFDRVAAGLSRIFAHDRDQIVPVVAECCRIKAGVVSRDEREAGPRRVLNFGHTVGHALEAITRYRRFRHGEAVAYGMLAAARISAGRGLLAADAEAQLKDLILHMGPLPLVTDLRIPEALEAIHRDKKVMRGRLHFVLATGIGSTMVADDVDTRELRAAMRGLGMKA
jgi:3-dehydroquinate synthase